MKKARRWFGVALAASACGGRSGLDAPTGASASPGAGGATAATSVSAATAAATSSSAGAGGTTVACEPAVLVGGPVNSVLTEHSGGPYAIAVDETHVYFSLAGDDGAVWCVPK